MVNGVFVTQKISDKLNKALEESPSKYGSLGGVNVMVYESEREIEDYIFQFEEMNGVKPKVIMLTEKEIS